MAAHVRVKDLTVLREHVEAVGTQTEVAARAGLSLQRLNQLLTGVGPVIDVEQAARLEEVLGVAYGDLFEAPKAKLMKHYIDANPDDDGELLAAYIDDDADDDTPPAPQPA